jgi:DNA replication and repair protein RecF
VLALKMAEATLLQEITDEPPVAFLDDVMSELDVSRQDYILNHIHDWQVFITCCEPSAALRLSAGKVFQIKQGVISE